ncbi:MAG: DsbA family protein [Candidatus Nanopelagicales bacterium]
MAKGSVGNGQGAPKRPNPKQIAAAAKAEAEAAERRRERKIRVVGVAAVLAVVAGLLVAGILAGRGDETPTVVAASPDPAAASPAGVQASTFGYPVGSGWKAKNATKLPKLEVWEDFQCPGCGQLEAAAGSNLVNLADEGKVRLLLRPTFFLDNNLPQSNRSSQRATAAWGCAIDAGKGVDYHSALFAAQPATEGEGFTDQKLLDLGQSVGLAGVELETFSNCVGADTYAAWAANSTQEFVAAGLNSTPTVLINGEKIAAGVVVDPEKLSQALAAAKS